MKASLEISMYPLTKSYGNLIIGFIQRLSRYEGLKVVRNRMSTQISGEYDLLMETVTREMKTSFEEDETVVMVMKLLNTEM